MKEYSNRKNVICLAFLALILISFSSCNFFGTDEQRTQVDISEPPVRTPPPENNYSEGEIIVKAAEATSLSEIDALVAGIRIKTIATIDGNRYLLYHVYDKLAVGNILMTLRMSEKVLAAEQNAVYTLYDYVPNDPYYAQYQYAEQITQCATAWEIEKGSEAITVAVLDTGINGEHEELSDRVLAGKNIITGADIPAGVNSDDEGHGSHVSGIIGAMGDNQKGIAGVAWHVKFLPVKIFANEGPTTTAVIAEGLIWAVDHGARVVNMSFGGGIFSMAVNDAVNYALQKDVVLIAAMGNENQYKVSYPAAMPGVIAVGSTNGRDKISFYSSKGNHISVAAPGESIYSLLNTSNTGYTFMSGTSMAAPFVAGLAALLLSHTPDLKPQEVRSLIEDTAEPLGAESFSPDYGYGRVNVGQALQAARHNDYGSVTVNVTNKGKAIGGVKVFLQSNDSSSTRLQSGLTSYGGTSGGTAGQIVFPYVRLGDYTVKVQMGDLQETPVTLTKDARSQTVDCAFETSLVLLVNAVSADDITVLTDEYLYTRELNKLGKYFTIWKTSFNGTPSSDLVNAYDLVIWFTGTTQDNPDKNIEVITDKEIAVLKNYMDQGGHLYLCGNNLAESLNKTDQGFLRGYLHARYSDSPFSNEDKFYGRDFIDGMQLLLSLGDDDQLYLETDATGLITSVDETGANHWAGLSWNGSYRLVFTTVCPNEILYSYPNTFFGDIIHWLETN